MRIQNLVFKNTKFISDELLIALSAYTGAKVKVTGGLDSRTVARYSAPGYVERTLYNPLDLYKIISNMKNIESVMNAQWTDKEKALFVFMELGRSILYDEAGNKSNTRNLCGILKDNNAVCSGYALIYKEMMDRLGIECRYCNAKSKHSWNQVKIDNKWYKIDLTWSLKAIQKGQGHFSFGTDEEFDKDPNHKLGCSQRIAMPDYDKDERFSIQEINKVMNTVYKTVQKPDKQYKTFTRDDGSTFVLKKNSQSFENMNQYIYIERGKSIEYATLIYSEQDFFQDGVAEKYISNRLLTSARIREKVKENGGYVGYVKDGSTYNSNVRFARSYQRTDGSEFELKFVSKTKGLNSYLYVERDEKRSVSFIAPIKSEMGLLSFHRQDKKVEDILLKSSRIKEKAQNGGYVGQLNDQGDKVNNLAFMRLGNGR